MANNQLVITDVGSTDWAGGTAPVGGLHTGTATITMRDGAQFVVAHNAAEVRRKLDAHATAPVTPAWVSFDVPLTVTPVVLNVQNVANVS